MRAKEKEKPLRVIVAVVVRFSRTGGDEESAPRVDPILGLKQVARGFPAACCCSTATRGVTTSIILDSSCALLSCPESESSSEPDGGLGELVLEVGVLGLERRDPLLCLKR